MLIVIYSGGDMIAQVEVKRGEKVTWNSKVVELQDKTLYLKCWHRTFIGPFPSGGSLSLWIPPAAAWK